MTATNVIEALAQVSREVGAIAKGRTAQAGGTYKYRGIDDVLNALHDPLADAGVVIVPKVTKGESIDRPNYGKNGAYEAQMLIEYRIFGPGGITDFIDAAVFATGFDTGDKGTGKAMSYAFKQLAFQLFCIPTDAAEDNEASHVERTARQPVPEDFYGWDSKELHDLAWETIKDNLLALSGPAKDAAVRELLKAELFKLNDKNGRVPALPFTPAQMKDAAAIVALAANVVADEDAAETVTPAADHSPHAIEVMCGALGVDDPLNPPEPIEQWMWDLAEVEDLDAYDWTPVIRATKCRAVGLLSRAQMVADRLIDAAQRADEDTNVRVPDAVKEIHGAVAAELRASVIKQEPVF